MSYEWTEARIAQLRDLWQRGTPTKEMAALLGVTKNAIVGMAHRQPSLEPRPSPIKSKQPAERLRQVVALGRDRRTHPQIAAATGVPLRTVSGMLAAAGICTRKAMEPPKRLTALPPQRWRPREPSFPPAPVRSEPTRFACLAPGEVPPMDGCTYIVNGGRPWQFCAAPAAVDRLDGTLVRRSFCAGHLRVVYTVQRAVAA